MTVPEVFTDASPLAVEQAAGRLRSRLRHDRWLASTNDYLHQAPAKIYKQFGRGRKEPLTHNASSLTAKHLAEYVAASTILHCSDGWAYLGRAMAAQLRGDSGTCRHLAYYAELRAAVSLLASQGVGVFAGIHVVLKESGDAQLFRQDTTHKFAWMALSRWTDLPESAQLFGQIIRPSDAPLDDWLAPLGGKMVTEATGRQYLRLWGLDVERFGRDREARNDSSYQPRTAFGAAPPSSARAAEFSRDFWRLFEPVGATKFGSLDRYLLRRTLRQMFEAQAEKTPEKDPGGFRAFFEPQLSGLQTSESRSQLVEFLSGESYPEEPPLFHEAEENSSIEAAEDHLQVVCRAALLLRVASGAARALLEEARLSYGEYEWWARQIAATRALAAEGDELLATPDSLWADIDQALDDLGDKIADGDADTYAHLGDRCAQELSLLGGCERIALWSLAA